MTLRSESVYKNTFDEEQLTFVVENVAVRLVERREKTLFKEMQSRSEFSLQTEQIGTLAIGIGSLDSEDLIERLCS